ncbi:Mde1 [Kluyveromyces lactis]|nr:Mde1 [Kluyveromyces lactis]
MSDPSETICSMCRLFYVNKWVLGTGGGIGIKQDNIAYISPSGIEKELMEPEQIVKYNIQDDTYQCDAPGLKPSACTPLFLELFKTLGASCVIHTHSINAVLCSMIFEEEFAIKDIEQIKAIPKGDGTNLRNVDTLRIPIIDNAPEEQDLMPALKQMIKDYPNACAVLVKKHGLFVWGPTPKKAKIYIESIDYLFEVALKMKELGQ